MEPERMLAHLEELARRSPEIVRSTEAADLRKQQREGLPLHARIFKVLTEMGLLEEFVWAGQPRADPHNKGRGKSSPPPGSSLAGELEQTLAGEWIRTFAALVELAETDLDRARGTRTPIPAHHHSQERDRMILSFEGKRPEFVAYTVGCSTRHVETLRSKKGLNPASGLPSQSRSRSAA
jgi:hypothetical protein